LLPFIGGGVDVETLSADNAAPLVMQLVADHDDLPHLAAGVDYAVPAAQRLAGPADGGLGRIPLMCEVGAGRL
jgi:hypothetical protein